MHVNKTAEELLINADADWESVWVKWFASKVGLMQMWWGTAVPSGVTLSCKTFKSLKEVILVSSLLGLQM